MSIASIVVGLLVLGVAFGLMVWGQKYLGELHGRNPERTGNTQETPSEDHPCIGCGSCSVIDTNKK